VKKWDKQTESIIDGTSSDVEAVKKSIDEVTREYLTPYENLQQPREKEDIWLNLIEPLLDGQVLTRVLGEGWKCESSREATWESEELDDAIRDAPRPDGQRSRILADGDSKDKGAVEKPSTKEHVDQGLNYTKIDLKRTWPLDAIGRERTIWARDRSWALKEVFNTLSHHLGSNDGTNLKDQNTTGQRAFIAELILSYLLTVLLANYSSTSQFKALLTIALTSSSAISSDAVFYVNILSTLQHILQCTSLLLGETLKNNDEEDEDEDEATGVIPEDPLLEDFISGGDTLLIKLLRQFNRNLAEQINSNVDKQQEEDVKALQDQYDQLKTYCRKSFSWYLDDDYVRKGMIQLSAEDGGESIEVELEDDEGEEYKPVIVEL